VDRLLETSPLFATLSREDARTLSERFRFLELAPDLRVIREGERAPGLFVLLTGTAQVVQGGSHRSQLGPGDVFGEMSLLAGGQAVASVVTTTKCWALELVRAEFQEVMVSYPQVLAYVSELGAERAELNHRVEFL
jgi:CPA1 family monovalent cation:H+ antiporter